ncbi:MAG: M67 family metallopeptidase [Thermoplasmata archaeon]
MKGLAVSAPALRAMRRYANAAYPEECCGFLLSPPEDASVLEIRPIVGSEPAPNRSTGERQRRFVILPQELREAEARAAERELVVSGFYHSHPDHPARPSVFDQEHAWPWYAYLILATDRAARASEVGAFELDPERREFQTISLTVTPPTAEALGVGLP